MATLTPLKANGGNGNSQTIYRWTYSGGTWVQGGNEGINAWNFTTAAITSAPANGDTGIGQLPGTNGTVTKTFDLTDMPTDFQSMSTLSIRYSTTLAGTTYSDDTGFVCVRIQNAAGTTILATWSGGSSDFNTYQGLDGFQQSGGWTNATVGLGANGTATAPAYNKTKTFGYVNTSASKSDWDGAVAVFNFTDTRNMGSDSATIVLVDFQLEGTYTPAITDVPAPTVAISATAHTPTITASGAPTAPVVEIVAKAGFDPANLANAVATGSLINLDTSNGGIITAIGDFYITPDGTKLFVTDTASDTVYRYSLNTAWDVSTAVYDSDSVSVTSQETNPTGLTFKPDGTRMYVTGTASDKVWQYNLSTPWLLSSATLDTGYVNPGSGIATAYGLEFSSDGLTVLLSGNAFMKYLTLTTPWQLRSGTGQSGTSTTADVDLPYGFCLSPDGRRAFIFDNGASIHGTGVVVYDLASPWNLVGATYAGHHSFPQSYGVGGIAFNSNGSRFYACDSSNSTIREYSLETPPTIDIFSDGNTNVPVPLVAISATPRAPSISASGTVAPTVVAANAVPQVPTVGVASVAIATSVALTAISLTPTVAASGSVTTATVSIGVTVHTPTIGGDAALTPTPVAVAAITYTPVILTATQINANVVAVIAVVGVPDIAASSTVTTSVVAVAASPQTPAVSASTIVPAPVVEIVVGGPVVSDSFNRANSTTSLGTADTGQTWTALAGTWGVSNNEAYVVTGSADQQSHAVVETGLSDCTLTLKYADATNNDAGLCFRAVDNDNLFVTGAAGVYKRTDGTFTNPIITWVTSTFGTGDVLKVVLTGTLIEVFRNSSFLGSVNDSSHLTATKHGLRSYFNAISTLRLDDFAVTGGGGIFAPTITATGTTTAPAVNLSASPQAPAVTATGTASPTVVALTAVPQTPTVDTGTLVPAPAVAITAAPQTPTVTATGTTTAPVVNLAAAPQAPTVTATGTPSPTVVALAAVPRQPTISTTSSASVVGTATITFAASGTVVKTVSIVGTSSLVLDAPADAAKTGASNSSTSFALAASGTDVKSGDSTGTATVTLSATATPTAKTASATAATSISFVASGLVGATENKSTTGATTLTLAASAAATKNGAASAATSLALAAAGTTVKTGATIGAGALTLSGVASPTFKAVTTTAATSISFVASGLVGATENKSTTATTSLSLSAVGTDVKAGDAAGAAGIIISAAAAVAKAGDAAATSGLVLAAAATTAKSVAATAAASFTLAASGIVGSTAVRSTVGSTSIVFNLVGSVTKTAAPYGTAAIAFGSLGTNVKHGTIVGAAPLVITTVGVPYKTTAVAASTALNVDAATTAVKAGATIGSIALALVGVGSVTVGDGSYAPDPGRTLTVGEAQRVLRVQPRRRVIHVGEADRRFTWH